MSNISGGLTFTAPWRINKTSVKVRPQSDSDTRPIDGVNEWCCASYDQRES